MKIWTDLNGTQRFALACIAVALFLTILMTTVNPPNARKQEERENDRMGPEPVELYTGEAKDYGKQKGVLLGKGEMMIDGETIWLPWKKFQLPDGTVCLWVKTGGMSCRL